MHRRLAMATVVLAATTAPRSPAIADERSAVEAAVVALTSADPAARTRAAASLGSYPEGARAMGALLEARADEAASVREAAATSLARLRERAFPEAVRMLAELPVGKFEFGGALSATSLLATATTATDLSIGLAEEGWETVFSVNAVPDRQEERAIQVLLEWSFDIDDPSVRRVAPVVASLVADGLPREPQAGVSKAVRDAEERLRALILESTTNGKRDEPRDRIALGLLTRSPLITPETISAVTTRARAGSSASRGALRSLTPEVLLARQALASLPPEDPLSTEEEDAVALVRLPCVGGTPTPDCEKQCNDDAEAAEKNAKAYAGPNGDAIPEEAWFSNPQRGGDTLKVKDLVGWTVNCTATTDCK